MPTKRATSKKKSSKTTKSKTTPKRRKTVHTATIAADGLTDEVRVRRVSDAVRAVINSPAGAASGAASLEDLLGWAAEDYNIPVDDLREAVAKRMAELAWPAVYTEEQLNQAVEEARNAERESQFAWRDSVALECSVAFRDLTSEITQKMNDAVLKSKYRAFSQQLFNLRERVMSILYPLNTPGSAVGSEGDARSGEGVNDENANKQT